MQKTLITLLSVLLTVGVANAQAPERVRGAITGLSGDTLSVKSGKGNVDIALAENTEIVYVQPIAIGDIKPGDFLGVTSTKGSDGSLTAFEVRRFPKPVNPGHRPFSGRDDQTMTNATVSAMVQSASGRELTLSYEGGSQKIVVSEKAAISMLVPGQRSQLVPGAAVNLTARPGADGKLTALRIQASPPGK